MNMNFFLLRDMGSFIPHLPGGTLIYIQHLAQHVCVTILGPKKSMEYNHTLQAYLVNPNGLQKKIKQGQNF
jgi:hypothetical protein